MNGKELDMPTHKNKAQQLFHWARFVAKNNSKSIIILITPNQNWHHTFNPHNGPFSKTQVTTHFKAYTFTYKKPIILPNLKLKPRNESLALHILYMHYKKYTHRIRWAYTTNGHHCQHPTNLHNAHTNFITYTTRHTCKLQYKMV